MEIGRRIFYDKATGNKIQDTGERTGDVVETTIEQDFQAYAALAERVPETVGVIELQFGQFAQDFAEGKYSVDITGVTPTLVFTYPDPNAPQAPPVYRTPLSVQVAEQAQRLGDIELAMAELFVV